MGVRKLSGEERFKTYCDNCKVTLNLYDTKDEAKLAEIEYRQKHGDVECTSCRGIIHRGVEIVDDCPDHNFSIFRAMVPGGWMVIVEADLLHDIGVDEEVCQEATHQLAMSFSPDLNHTWKLKPRTTDGKEEK